MKRWDNAEEMAMSCHPVVLFPLKPVKKKNHQYDQEAPSTATFGFIGRKTRSYYGQPIILRKNITRTKMCIKAGEEKHIP
jgi:hypothetical protein